MKKFVKFILAVVAIVGYFMVLRYIAPSREPYFILGVGLIGFIAWLYGVTAGLVLAALLVPVTHYIYDQFTVSTSYLSFASSPAYIALELLTAVALGRLRKTTQSLSQKETDLASFKDNIPVVLFFGSYT